MKCKVQRTAETDRIAWVSREAFESNVNFQDLACRESREILDKYHPGWFDSGENEELIFVPPAFIFQNGQLRGINGRHRAVLLFRHMDTIPMLLVLPEEWPPHKLSEIIHREINEDEYIELPDLPFQK